MGADANQALMELGLTGLEAEIYTHLHGEPAATGYRIAQGLGKPAANTYKAIESLERKGAVVVDDGENRLCRAVPPSEFFRQLETRFSESRRRATDAMSNLPDASADDRVYQLRSRKLVLERCRSMLDQCREVALLDAGPEVVHALELSLKSAAVRGVEVVIKTYTELAVEGVRVIVRPRGHEIMDAVPGDLINLNVDGSEHLLGVLHRDGDDVYQAIWTQSVIVSYVLYNGMINEVSQTAVMAELDGEPTVESLRATFTSLRHLHPISSRGTIYQNLLRRLGVPADGESASNKTNGEKKRKKKS